MGSEAILIVEDDRAEAAFLARLVAGAGGAAQVCSTLERARRHLSSVEIDLVILDQQLPDGDGTSLLAWMRGQTRTWQTPVVFVTADERLALRRRALVGGANDFLTKPVDAVEFICRVQTQLEFLRSRRALERRAALLVGEVAAQQGELRRRELETIERLSRIAELRDSDTGMHIVRMARYCELIGRAYGLTDAEAQTLRLAAPMHDVGKIATPDEVLFKPGPHTEAERAIMREHARAGYDILADGETPLLQTAAEIALTHHERWDGFGYPDGLAADDIPLCGRIASLADVFDALTTKRVYKTAWPIDAAVDEIVAQRGLRFDPDLVDAFREALPDLLSLRERYADA